MNNKVAIYVRVSTDEQRDNGYSIDSQLRMIKEYCEKNNYDIVDVYNDAGYYGKDLMSPEMQRLLKEYIDIQKFNKEYPILKLAKTNKFHDRFIVIDNQEIYHLGASIKDLAKKCFGINKIEDMEIIKKIINL